MSYDEILIETKRKIKEKFGTLLHFGNSVGLPYAELNKFFAKRMRITEADVFMRQINELMETKEPIKHPNQIQQEDREYIRAKILINYKNVERFLVDNPEFTKSFISNVINGRKIRSDKRFQRLKATVELLKYKPEEI